MPDEHNDEYRELANSSVAYNTHLFDMVKMKWNQSIKREMLLYFGPVWRLADHNAIVYRV